MTSTKNENTMTANAQILNREAEIIKGLGAGTFAFNCAENTDGTIALHFDFMPSSEYGKEATLVEVYTDGTLARLEEIIGDSRWTHEFVNGEEVIYLNGALNFIWSDKYGAGYSTLKQTHMLVKVPDGQWYRFKNFAVGDDEFFTLIADRIDTEEPEPTNPTEAAAAVTAEETKMTITTKEADMPAPQEVTENVDEAMTEAYVTAEAMDAAIEGETAQAAQSANVEAEQGTAAENSHRFMVCTYTTKTDEFGVIGNGSEMANVATAQQAAQFVIDFAAQNNDRTVTGVFIKDFDTYKEYRATDADLKAIDNPAGKHIYAQYVDLFNWLIRYQREHDVTYAEAEKAFLELYISNCEDMTPEPEEVKAVENVEVDTEEVKAAAVTEPTIETANMTVEQAQRTIEFCEYAFRHMDLSDEAFDKCLAEYGAAKAVIDNAAKIAELKAEHDKVTEKMYADETSEATARRLRATRREIREEIKALEAQTEETVEVKAGVPQIAKFEAGKTYYRTWSEDTGRPHIAKYTIAKRTAKTIVLQSGARCKINVSDEFGEMAKVGYGTYLYAKDLYNGDAVKRQAESDRAWDDMDRQVNARARELKALALADKIARDFHGDDEPSVFNLLPAIDTLRDVEEEGETYTAQEVMATEEPDEYGKDWIARYAKLTGITEQEAATFYANFNDMCPDISKVFSENSTTQTAEELDEEITAMDIALEAADEDAAVAPILKCEVDVIKNLGEGTFTFSHAENTDSRVALHFDFMPSCYIITGKEATLVEVYTDGKLVQLEAIIDGNRWTREVVNGEDVVYFNGEFNFLASDKYDAWLAIHGQLPILRIKGLNARFAIGDDEFFKIMAERGACTLDPEEPEPPADNFTAELAARKATYETAQANADKATEAVIAARRALHEAEEAEQKAKDIENHARAEYERLGERKAGELRDKLITDDVINATIGNWSLSQLWIGFWGGKFTVSDNWQELAQYDTPEQVSAVIDGLKAAIERGDKRFTFPPADEVKPEPPAPRAKK